MWHVFAVFQARGATHVDLKTDLVVNADAARLYRRLDMVEVDWEGLGERVSRAVRVDAM